ncbi:ISL3 family transposase [Thalassobacillus sp. B23F22_16]|uniref:ISL3 family transposase n=1 Tax=Thalassobacillus sp. B23F22_16 TaxID=3459513 RepID=UPI00373F6FFB
MNSNMSLPGLKDIVITNEEERNGAYYLHIEVPQKPHQCPKCGEFTSRVHDYRAQKVQHLKVCERTTYLYYRRRRYVCPCGKRFSEDNTFVERYQRHSKEWNQALGFRVIQGKNFKDTARQFRTSPTTVIRRFDEVAAPLLQPVKELPPVIAIDEYKGDTNKGKFQVIIADGDTRKPLDILPDRSVSTVKKYLREKGERVEMVIMDMSPTFKSAVRQALGDPIIIADRFHFCRYIYWALELVRRRVQKDFHDYDRKKCKRMRHVFNKPIEDLTEKQGRYLSRYISFSEDLQLAHRLKEEFRGWMAKAKELGLQEPAKVKETLFEFYDRVKAVGLPEFEKAIQTFKNWQPEILNSFTFGYSSGFIEGLNNQTKVIKRNAFGFRKYERFRNRVLLHHQYKHMEIQMG